MVRRSLVLSLIVTAACASPRAVPLSVAPALPANATASAEDPSGEPRIVVTPTAVLVDGSAVEDIRGFDHAQSLSRTCPSVADLARIS